MTHYTTVVIVPDPQLEKDDIESIVEDALAPFDEGTQVTGYHSRCYCVNMKAREAARTAANEQVGSIDKQRDEFKNRAGISQLEKKSWNTELNSEERRAADEELDALWKVFLAPWEERWNAIEQATLKAHPEFMQPNVECETCHGSGWTISQYNPLSKWDWWSYGGRWNGALQGKREERDDDSEVKGNVMPLLELVQRFDKGEKLFVPYGIITPDGIWHSQGRMGWWGMSSGDIEQKAWEDKVLEIYREYATGSQVVLLDLHI